MNQNRQFLSQKWLKKIMRYNAFINVKNICMERTILLYISIWRRSFVHFESTYPLCITLYLIMRMDMKRNLNYIIKNHQSIIKTSCKHKIAKWLYLTHYVDKTLICSCFSYWYLCSFNLFFMHNWRTAHLYMRMTQIYI